MVEGIENLQELTIKKSYKEIRVLYVGCDPIRNYLLSIGKVEIFLNGDKTFSVEGNLNPVGQISGLAKLYRYLNLKEGQIVKFAIQNGSVVIYEPSRMATDVVPTPVAYAEDQQRDEGQTVFSRKKLKNIFIQPFRPENLNNWEPETETDVYLAFGVLQEYTDFQYCCGASKHILDKLGASYGETSKPDAILIDRTTDEYLIGEWKIRSSDYALNHQPEDVDVLICWLHDETKGPDFLPKRVVSLKDIARTAAQENLCIGGGS